MSAVYYSAADPVPLLEGQTSYWPSSSVLTARLRRLITASQRYTKSRQILNIHQAQSLTQSMSQSQQAMMLSAPLCPLPPTLDNNLNPKMAAKFERQQRSGHVLDIKTGHLKPFMNRICKWQSK